MPELYEHGGTAPRARPCDRHAFSSDMTEMWKCIECRARLWGLGTFTPTTQEDPMLAIDPTWEVIVNPDQAPPLRRVYRVPQGDIERFLHVLMFNGTEDIRVMLEKPGVGQ